MRSPVPVLLMVQALEAGGTERQVAELAMSMDRSRFTPHVACFRSGGMRWDEVERAGVPLIHLPMSSFRSSAALKAVWRLGRYLREERIPLVHTFDPPSNLFGVPAARLVGALLVLSSQRSFRSLRPSLRHILRLQDRMTDGIVVNSVAVKESLIEEDRVPPSKIHLCYNGIDAERFHARRPERGNGPLVIAFVGVLRVEKSLETLLDAFARLGRDRSDVQLRLIGEGPSGPGLMQRAQELGLGENCRFLPFTARADDALREADIFVLPSVSEALSNSLMEAMSCGCAVVASRIGGNPELVTHGESGLIFEARDVAGLAGHLRRLIEDECLRLRLGQSAAQRMRRYFGKRTSADRMGDIYEKYLTGDYGRT